jgi:FHS family L-fucose permease-like MFS transporter
VSLFAGKYITRHGFKKGILLGLIISCLGCFSMFGAISFYSFEILLFAFFLLASGNAILQVGANLYIVLSGGKANSASRLNFTQGFNSLGTTIAPVLATHILIYLVQFNNRDLVESLDLFEIKSLYIHFPYLIVGVILLFVIAYFIMLRIPQIDISHLAPDNLITSLRKVHVMHFAQLRLGAFAIFAYVGAEVALSNYLFDFAPGNIAYYWGLMILGRFIGSFLLLKVSPRDLVGYAGCICLSLLLLSVFTTGNFSYLAITCIGLFNSIMFPTIYTLSVNGLGRFSIYGSAVLIMAISGGALIPFIVRNFSYVSYEFAFLIVGICYFYIILYGWKLSRYQKKSL